MGLPRAQKYKTLELANVGCLIRVLTLMEDTVLACALSKHWGHPLNRGWVTCFARWATAPTFRMWWPLLRPMYGPGLRQFLEDRFVVLRMPSSATGSVSSVSLAAAEQGFAFKWWKERDRLTNLDGRRLRTSLGTLLREGKLAAANSSGFGSRCNFTKQSVVDEQRFFRSALPCGAAAWVLNFLGDY